MEFALLFLSLVYFANGQFMSTWGSSSGYNQMHMPMPYNHMPYGHWREAGVEGVAYGPSSASKSEGIIPFQIFRTKFPSKLGVQDYAFVNVNAPEQEDAAEHLIYRQTIGDVKRPLMGLISLLPSQIPLPVGGKPVASYQDQGTDDMMTCVGGGDVNEPMKVHPPEQRFIITRTVPYYTQAMHKIKI